MNLVAELSMKLKMALHPGITKISVGGTEAKFIVDTRAEYNRFYDINDEEPVIKDILSEIEQDDCFWDVGANVGLYSCLIDQKCEVRCFEPLPANIDRLQDNRELNDCSFEIDERALSDETAKSYLKVNNSEAGEGKSHISNSGLEIETVRGDELHPPDIVKIDVEGAEEKVIQGLEGIIDEIRILYIEEHEGIKNIEDMIDKDHEVILQRGTERFLKFS